MVSAIVSLNYYIPM